MRLLIIAAGALVLTACGGPAEKPAEPAPDAKPAPTTTPDQAALDAWVMASDGDTMTLTHARMVIGCNRARREFQVTLPGVTPIGSEERLSFGSGGNVTAMVADTAASAVKAATPITQDLLKILQAGEPLSASYGATSIGPLDGPAKLQILSPFVANCRAILLEPKG